MKIPSPCHYTLTDKIINDLVTTDTYPFSDENTPQIPITILQSKRSHYTFVYTAKGAKIQCYVNDQKRM